MKLLTNLKVSIKLWQHKQKAHGHRGNVVSYILRITPYYRVYKCSFCGTHIEVRV